MPRSHTENKINLPSAVEPFLFEGRRLYIKRDDLVDPDLSGNKFRKLYFLLNTPSSEYRHVISYGGSQSNAMASIAAMCRRKRWDFLYITKALSSTLKGNISGNLKAALDDGMQLLELAPAEYRAVVESLYSATPDTRVGRNEYDLILAQGGADPGAREGIGILAEEIKTWKRDAQIEKLTVVLPSGTGTTAYFLAAALPGVRVLTTPLIGPKEYLEEQMLFLGDMPENLTILETEENYRFAKPYKDFLELYRCFSDQGIELDLLYAPKMFIALSEVLETIEDELLYIHTGGVKGNSSMLERYRHKGL